MTGITKFFKPTGGNGGAIKKSDKAPGTSAREVFSNVDNIKGAQRAAVRPTMDTDSDVEILGGEVSFPSGKLPQQRV